ncbi:acyl-CoA dehydrogenase [Amycolatopsis sp.]|uniref:acyl-CoA dehydrogenase n=1 Tax=Amycolatopsis sp. TaxID=37632 RepID=UPI002D7E9EB9|nr:acyl-CoA dehydrogenase [Amycolatopsis sp.]HET6707837.1 acyl-CoA dehydrogenase [Amycolatopsis sp.]
MTGTTSHAFVHGHGDPNRAEILGLFSHELFRPRTGQTHAEQCRLTYERLRWLGPRLPPATELLANPRALLGVLETAAVASPSVFLAMTIHCCLSTNAIVEYGGGRRDLAPWLTELDTMASIGTLVVTELGHGNSHLAIRTEARLDRGTGEFVLHTPDPAARKFMSNNSLDGVPKIGVVYARLLDGDTDHGVFPFVLRLRREHGVPDGIRIHALPETWGMPLDYSVIEFTQVRIPRYSLLHDSAAWTPDGGIVDPLGPALRLKRSLAVRENAWMASAAALAAVSRAAVAIAVRHAAHRLSRSRFSGERAVLEFRPQQHALFGALAAACASTALVERAKRAWCDPVGDDPLWSRSAALGRTLGLVKASACHTAYRVTETCGLRSGAHGMFLANRLAEYQGLAHMLNPAAGDGRLIELDAGRSLAEGEHYRPPQLGHPVVRDLWDPVCWRELAAYRERRLHERLTRELEVARRRGQDPFHAWNNRLALGRELAAAHVRRLELDCFIEAAAAVPDHRRRAAWERLVAWFAGERLRTDLAWYLTEGVLTADQARTLPPRFDLLAEELLPHVVEIVESFGLPDELLNSPLVNPQYAKTCGEADLPAAASVTCK